jgi:thiamine pyrophosphokinase
MITRRFFVTKKFEKWYTAKTPISLIPIGHVTGIHSENLFYPLKMTALPPLDTGSSNHVTNDGMVLIEHLEVIY